MANTYSHTLTKDEKSRYLRQLDAALATLEMTLNQEQTTYRTEKIKALGERHAWDESRLPRPGSEYRTLAYLVGRIRKEYAWFHRAVNETAPENNYDYFEEIDVSADSGLPGVFSFVALHRSQEQAPSLLVTMPDYKDLAGNVEHLLRHDFTDTREIPALVSGLQQTALQRRFLERIQGKELIPWEAGKTELFYARKIFSLPQESLWHLHCVKYRPEASMFEAYVLDLWQDNGGNEIQRGKTEEEGILSEAFKSALDFGIDNAPWYIISALDERFTQIHPVHVSRCLFGPFENKYHTRSGKIKQLPVLHDLLHSDASAGFLRASILYSYAPNHEIGKKGIRRQFVHRETWSDEYLAVPGHHAAQVSASLAGTDIHIGEIGVVQQ